MLWRLRTVKRERKNQIGLYKGYGYRGCKSTNILLDMNNVLKQLKFMFCVLSYFVKTIMCDCFAEYTGETRVLNLGW